MSRRIILFAAILVPWSFASSQTISHDEEDLTEWNHRIRREKFDIVVPEVMRRNDVDMWIHVMRETIEDPFGAEDLGATSGVFVFSDRGTDRIERAVLGRRWGDSQAGETWRVTWNTRRIEESGAYDIIHDPVLVLQPPGGPETEYDYRFEGLREFVAERDPERMAAGRRERLPRYPMPVLRLARLAAHEDAQGRGVGRVLSKAVFVFESQEAFEAFASSHAPVHEQLGLTVDDIIKTLTFFEVEKRLE